MTHIHIIKPEESEGELKKIYDEIKIKRGKIADVYQIQSLNPQSIKDHLNLYMTIMFGKSSLKRVTRELIGTVVSLSNKCNYCVTHHSQAVNHYWKNNDRLDLLIKDFREADLNEIDLALAEYAEDLTLNPLNTIEGSHANKLRQLGLKDDAILDATLIISYFNFVNRIVLSMGVNIEPDSGLGYKML